MNAVANCRSPEVWRKRVRKNERGAESVGRAVKSFPPEAARFVGFLKPRRNGERIVRSGWLAEGEELKSNYSPVLLGVLTFRK